jgi:hypothetical protein
MEGTIGTPVEARPRPWLRWLNYLLQALWIVSAVFIVQLFILSIRPGYVELSRVCTEPVCPDGQLTLQGLDDLERLGISVSTFALLQLVFVFSIAAIYTTVSLLIFRARRHDNVALYVALVLLYFGAFVSTYVEVLREVQPSMTNFIDLLPGITLISFTILCYVFPDGRFVPRWTRWAAWGWIAAPIVMLIATIFDAFEVIEGPMSVVLLGLLATCIIAPIYRYRKLSSHTQRLQLKWVLFGLAQLPATLLIVVELLPLAFPASDVVGTVPNIVSNIIQSISLAIFPISIGIALLRYRLWNVDLVINRSLVYIPLTSILTVIYTTSIAISQRLFATATGEQSQAVAIFTTIVLTTTFTPIKNALQSYVDKNFKEAPGNLKELKELNKQVTQVVEALDHKSLAQRVVESIVQAHYARGAALYLREGERMVLTYATADWVWAEGEVSILLAENDEVYGRLLLGQRRDRDDYTLDEIEDIRKTTLPIARNMHKLAAMQEEE